MPDRARDDDHCALLPRSLPNVFQVVTFSSIDRDLQAAYSNTRGIMDAPYLPAALNFTSSGFGVPTTIMNCASLTPSFLK
jgi:hypothetical protein